MTINHIEIYEIVGPKTTVTLTRRTDADAADPQPTDPWVATSEILGTWTFTLERLTDAAREAKYASSLTGIRLGEMESFFHTLLNRR